MGGATTKAATSIALCLTAVAAAVAADNLICNGDFSDETLFRRECRAGAGKLTLGVEDATWNKYGRIEVTEAVDNKAKNTKVTKASVLMGLDRRTGTAGFPVTPGEVYEYSFELRGHADHAFVSVYAWGDGGNEAIAKRLELAVPRLSRVNAEWTPCRGVFRVPQGMTHASIGVSLWWDTVYGAERIHVGDYLDFDNVFVKLRKSSIAEFAKKAGSPFVVAQVPVTVDARVPFVPEEIYTPPSNILLRAAVNEIKALPLAIANLTSSYEEYRVVLETVQPMNDLVPGNSMDKIPHQSARNGRFGLDGFPQSQIVQRRGIAVKDTEEGRDSRRIDPMERIGEAHVVCVPPHEAGLVWFDFDTTDVRPGLYAGRLRVIPLSEPTKTRRVGGFHDRVYEGAMQDLPVTLEVLPIVLPKDPVVPGGFYGYAENREMFREMLSMGAREFQVTPWSLKFPLDGNGCIVQDPGSYQPSTHFGGDARRTIRAHLDWAAESRVKIRFLVCYSCYRTVCSLYGLSPGSEESLRLWPQWIKALKRFMNAQGVADDDYIVEIWDEPDRTKVYELVKETARLAHEAEPTLCLLATFNYNPWTEEDLDSLSPWMTGWIFYDNKFLRGNIGKYAKVVEKLKRRGDFVSHYTCSKRMQENLDREFRQNAWVAEAHGLNGNHIYQIVEVAGGAGVSNWKTKQYGGLLYRSYDDFMPSLRALALRQGVQDVKYLKALRDAGCDSPAARELLKNAAQRVISNPPDGDRNLEDRIRDEAIELILKSRGGCDRPQSWGK